VNPTVAVWYVEEYGLWRWRFRDGDVIMGEGVALDEPTAQRSLERALSEYKATQR
jgi:hypothetical protein